RRRHQSAATHFRSAPAARLSDPAGAQGRVSSQSRSHDFILLDGEHSENDQGGIYALPLPSPACGAELADAAAARFESRRKVPTKPGLEKYSPREIAAIASGCRRYPHVLGRAAAGIGMEHLGGKYIIYVT